jgi:hypothetical protein
MSTKIKRAIRLLQDFDPSARDPLIAALEKYGLVDVLTAAQLALITRLMQQAYNNGKAHRKLETIDDDAVRLDGAESTGR